MAIDTADLPVPDLRLVDQDDSVTRICKVLRRLQDQRCLLTVTVGRNPDAYTSAILEVNHDGEYFVMDELVPRSGHERLADTKEIHVRARLDSLEVRFTSRVTRISVREGLPYYKVPFPADVDFPQRRQVHRVPVPLNTGLPVSVLMPDERIFAGELRDVSPEGIGIRVRTGVPDIDRDRGSHAICEIRLPRGVEFVADIEVCHIDLPARGRVPRIGARFVSLNGMQTRRLEQFCAALAREQRRLR